jgi:hypothetical protein
MIRNMIRFCGEELLAHRPNSTPDDYSLSAVRDCLFNTFAATLHIGGRSFIRGVRTRHSVVRGTNLSRFKKSRHPYCFIKLKNLVDIYIYIFIYLLNTCFLRYRNNISQCDKNFKFFKYKCGLWRRLRRMLFTESNSRL